jgi:hypothetical protein
VLLLCLEFFVFPENKNPYSIKHKLLQDYDTEIIIGGNSHTNFGVLADSLTISSVNTANKGREIETDIAIINNLEFEKYNDLKAIVIPISFYSLFSNLDDTNDEFLVDQKRLYYHFYNINEYSQGIITDRLLFNTPTRELFKDSYILPFLNKNNFSPKGWRANDNIFQHDNEIFGKLKKVDLKLANKVALDKNLELLKNLMNKCKENKVKLYIMIPPYSSVYFTISKHKYNNLILKILQENFNSEDFILINSNTFMPSSLEYYENSDHLNLKGAIAFTKKLDSVFNKTLR